MKVITAPEVSYKEYDAIKITKSTKPEVLIELGDLKQELIKEDGKIYFVSSDRIYNQLKDEETNVNQKLLMEDGDFLIELGNGYAKPAIDLTEVKAKLNKAIETIREYE